MSVVLVLEPDGAQAEQLLRVLRKRVRADAVLATSTAVRPRRDWRSRAWRPTTTRSR